MTRAKGEETMQYRKLKAYEIVRATDEVLVDEIGWVPGSLNVGKKLPEDKVGRYRRPLKSKPKNQHTQMAAALWRELNRSCPALVPLKTDWVAVTEKRLNSAITKVLGL